MTDMELDIIVSDSLDALKLYESIFEAERIEVTSLPKGQNEAIFSIYGTKIHMLDANPEFQMVAPRPGDAMPFWFNVTVPDIKATLAKAIEFGCKEVQPITDYPTHGVLNAFFSDPFGYTWMLHEVYKEVSFEDRVRAMENMK